MDFIELLKAKLACIGEDVLVDRLAKKMNLKRKVIFDSLPVLKGLSKVVNFSEPNEMSLSDLFRCDSKLSLLEVKPCPFCGALRPMILEGMKKEGKFCVYINCKMAIGGIGGFCTATMRGKWKDTEDEAILSALNMWNTRNSKEIL